VNEQELVKGLIDSGIIAILVAYIFRLDNQRTANEAIHRQTIKEMSDARADDNNRWLAIYARGKGDIQPFTSKSPTTLE
jgi:hypothetical protein